MRSPRGSAFAAAAPALLEAAEAEDPLAMLVPPVAVAVAVAVAAGPLHTIDLGIVGKVDATDVGVEKEGRDTLAADAAEAADRGGYVPVYGDVVNR